MKTLDEQRARLAAVQAKHAKPVSAVTPAPERRYGTDALEFLSVVDDDADTYIVAGLVPEGMPTMLVGTPKARKSWIELYLAVCIAAGVPAFGRPTRRGRVLVIAREDTARETRRRLRLIMRALNVQPEQLHTWLRVDSTQPLYLDQLPDVQALAATLDEFKPVVTFIDSLSRVHNRNEDSKTEMALVLNIWSDLCSRFSCAVVLLHHCVKWGDGGSLIQKIRGSGDIGAVLRVAIGVTKISETSSRIEVDGNLADMAGKFEVSFVDQVTNGERVGLSITAIGDSSVDDSDELSAPLVSTLVTRLEANSLTHDKLRKGLGGSKVVDGALAMLVRRGLVEKIMHGRRHGGYKLTDKGRAFASGRVETADRTAPLPMIDGLIGGKSRHLVSSVLDRD